ncbi:hypothetical protein [Mycobacterium lacus]|uniref:Uncharacterized protein n=1 Tax=Mycobacterium lacus TaxID=169765 RepID=A0A1X1XTG5_9MYCO|nr:hypothetical protein [Mycobacterium lacus]MCV7124557.1 hypothetical protein [Mycobacterium lacus]ORW02061.1 hypothetical protein AWC15_07075 [Mycobacterium lacus]BBX99432.1 hypothetical protein MLAC_47260 [Mycobacterium lacus]
MNAPTLFTAALAIATAVSPQALADSNSLPPCPVAAISPTTRLPHPDCRLHAADRVGANFAVTYWSLPEAPGPRAVTVMVTDASGAAVQKIDELLEPSSPSGVGMQDLDGDGRDEVIIPIAQHGINGSPNTRFAVWRAAGDSTHFERTQMLGQAVYASGDGYVVTNGGSPSSRDLTFYLPTGAGFTLVVVLTVEAEQVDPGTHRVLTVRCHAHQEDGLHAVDMDVSAAQETFCASPAARAIWPGAQRVAP